MRWNSRTPVQREWEALCKKERRLLNKRSTEQDSALARLLAKKVPDKLQHTLHAGFAKSFSLIFEKGVGIIEKTYDKDAWQKEFQVQLYADELQGSRKSLRAFTQKAKRAGRNHVVISGVSGVGMGLLGIGLPDIPLFTSMALKCVYQTALAYGFDYDTPAERYLVLLILEGAMAHGAELERADQRIEEFLRRPILPEGYDQAEQISRTSRALSQELLCMKFLQGIPLVGAVGGAYDMRYMGQISAYAKLKYQKRFLLARLYSGTPDTKPPAC